MNKKNFVFKDWVPLWLIRTTLFLVILPSLILFFLPLSNVNAAAGHTGIETYDVIFSVMLFYAGYTSFFSLERRFFMFLPSKEYFIIITFIQIITSYVCYVTHELAVLFIFRFIQGMAFTMTVNLSLSLVYKNLRTSRARTIGYSIFFGMLICMIPFDNFITAELIDSFNFNIIYKCAAFSYIPSLFLMFVLMNNIRLDAKFPLYQLDWPSFLLYGTGLSLVGYVMVYGQEYYWLDDKRIAWSVISIFGLLVIFIVRQKAMKRPYFNLDVFKYRNFIFGGFVILVLYISRFAFGITTSYFQTVLKLDPIHIGNITLLNILGVIIGVVISCVFVLQKRPIRLLWVYGFSILLLYHVWMIFLFLPEANENNFYIPIVLQGLGVGLLMTPSIIFMVSSVPERLSITSAGVCLLMRCLGFYMSIALMNYFELYSKSKHFNTFQNLVNYGNPVLKNSLSTKVDMLVAKGLHPSISVKASEKLLVGSLEVQNKIRYAIDYYEMISVMVITIIIAVALFPYINKTVLSLSKKRPFPF